MAKITNTLLANITATEDSTSSVIVNRSNGTPAYDSNVAQMTEYFVLAGGPNVIPMPVGFVTQLYICNKDAAKGITVIWTPTTGVAATIIALNPGDMIMFWCNPAGAVVPDGISALTLTPSAAGALVEFFLGG